LLERWRFGVLASPMAEVFPEAPRGASLDDGRTVLGLASGQLANAIGGDISFGHGAAREALFAMVERAGAYEDIEIDRAIDAVVTTVETQALAALWELAASRGSVVECLTRAQLLTLRNEFNRRIDSGEFVAEDDAKPFEPDDSSQYNRGR
jgi:hypothetical protein